MKDQITKSVAKSVYVQSGPKATILDRDDDAADFQAAPTSFWEDDHRDDRGEKIHVFYEDLALGFSPVAAVLIEYFRLHCSRYELLHDKEHFKHDAYWHFASVDYLASRFKYLGQDQIARALGEITSGDDPIMRREKLGCEGDQTYFYSFIDENDLKPRKKAIKFNNRDAEKYGLVAACLLLNIRFWLMAIKDGDARKHEGTVHEKKPWVRLSVKKLAGLLPWSAKTLHRALKHLEQEGVLMSRSERVKRSWYTCWTFVDEANITHYHPENKKWVSEAAYLLSQSARADKSEMAKPANGRDETPECLGQDREMAETNPTNHNNSNNSFVKSSGNSSANTIAPSEHRGFSDETCLPQENKQSRDPECTREQLYRDYPGLKDLVDRDRRSKATLRS